jgi:cardiolipin synthase
MHSQSFRKRPGRLRSRLHPWPRRRLPKALRPRQAMREAEGFAGGVRDPAFERLVQQIDTGPIHHGDDIRLYFSGEVLFEAVRREIGHAREEILFESYIFKDDETGYGVLALLADAARRGVKVRVLADGYGSWTTRARFWRKMQQDGIEGRLFHPLWTQWRYHRYRDHRKILVVDRKVAFTGGMNIANEYGSSRLAAGHIWRDTHARVEGQTAWEMALVFREGWLRAKGSPFEVPSLEPKVRPGTKILVLDTRAGRGQREIIAVLATIFGAARRRLWITNPYFAPGHRSIAALARTAARGVDVRLLLPGISDVPIVQHAAHGYYTELLNAGVRIFEYQPSVLHAKTLLADEYVSIVGSSNLDYRSFLYNAECNLLMLDEATNHAVAEAFLSDLGYATEVTVDAWRERSWLHRVGDRLARALAPLL